MMIMHRSCIGCRFLVRIIEHCRSVCDTRHIFLSFFTHRASVGRPGLSAFIPRIAKYSRVILFAKHSRFSQRFNSEGVTADPMASTLTNLLIHMVFGTKGRESTVTDNYRGRLYAYGGADRDTGQTWRRYCLQTTK